jgi:DNA-binding NtrC family response regulator
MNKTEQQNSNPPRVDPLLVFVVDDESAIGEVVAIILRRNGYKPRFFQNPEHAWEVLVAEEPKPALLMTDYVMQPLNGMELIQRCKKQQPGLRTLLYSGNADEEILRQYSIEPDGFLQKPFLPSALIEVVRFVMESQPGDPSV